MSDTIQFIPQRRFYDTATVAETHLIRQGVLPAVKIGRKSLLYYPNVIKLLTEGNNHVSSDDERPSYIPAKISV